MCNYVKSSKQLRETKSSFLIPIVFLGILIGLSAFNTAYGMPAAPTIHELVQPDGTRIKARLWGDEWMHGWETAEGYTIVKNAKGFWTFATKDVQSGKLAASETMASNEATASSFKTHVRPDYTGPAKAYSKSFPSTGNNNIPTLLINYKDTTTTNTSADFQSLLFGTRPAIASGPGSMKDFYNEVSYGQLTISSGPSGVSNWLTASKNHDDYGVENGFEMAAELVKEAILAADAAGFDFSQYDNDRNGKVDVVMIAHQGEAYEATGDSTCIWSHSWSLSSAGVGAVTVDGVIVDDYIIQPERSDNQISTVGVFCHEFGHAMGLPDLYDYDYDSSGAGAFCLMASGSWNGLSGDTPAQLSAWCKVQLGWVNPTPITSDGTYLISEVERAAQIYKLQGRFSSNEYFLLENRQGTGFDQELPGIERGLLIWHVDDNIMDNDDQSHYLVDLEEAGGIQHLELGIGSGDDLDYFRAGNATQFTESSAPNNRSYSGILLGQNVNNVSASGSSMTFNVSSKPSWRLKAYTVPSISGEVKRTPNKASYDDAETVMLLAVAPDGWEFVEWGGDVTGTENPIQITVTGNKTVRAVFKPSHLVKIIATGQGQVEQSQEGVKFDPNTRLTLTATPAEGWVFRKWWGDVDSTDNPVTVTVDGEKFIQAEFVNPNVENCTLSISNVGNGRTLPFGGSFVKGSTVSLTATPASGCRFVQWRGDIVSTSNPLEVTMDGNKCVTAVFCEQNAEMPADETVQGDTSANPVSSQNPAQTATEKNSDFELPNLFDSCTLLATVVMTLVLGGFGLILIKE
jgi:M6 family metalloprotease-like protein